LGGRVPVVIAPPSPPEARRRGVDESLPVFGDETRRRSATLLVQEYLNAADEAMWGIAIDGPTLRILRDNASLTRPAWIEADVERILGERLFPDFSVLWLLLHESRFGRAGAPAADCPIERWRERGRAEGVTARERLADGVEAALRTLGDGFLKHPANAALRAALTEGRLDERGYFQELLRLVYRFIFLFAAEDRRLLHPPGATESARQLYAEGYSLARLRERAVRRAAHDRHHDLYEGVKLVAAKLVAGEPKLALPALGGLFGPGQTPHLDQAQLGNRELLGAIFWLAWLVDRDSERIERVNWRDMETEELGSVYESLLELAPRLEAGATGFDFAKGDEAKGNARKTSGSYYTPDALVQLLLDSALDPVIEAAIKGNPGREVDALLALDVIDPACGSGHFLLAAARRIAQRIAQLRSPGAPSADDYRRALREVARHYLYGVDRNPLAVELCRVALWIETVEPGKPLSYLGGRIRQGDSLIGVFDLAVLADGIPDAAYKALTGDDKAAAKYYAARNRKERKDRPTLPFAGSLAALSRAALSLDAMPEDEVGEIARKETAFKALESNPDSWRLKVACDLYVAAFFTPKVPIGFVMRNGGAEPENPNTVTVPTTDHIWCRLRGHHLYGPLEAAAIDIADRIGAFHWPLAFPDVFDKGGFDCALGNPPWERIKLQEQEFFATRAPEIANAPNKAAREKLIANLIASDAGEADRSLYADFQFSRREVEAASTFARESGRFPLTGVGDINTYALFAEHFSRLAACGDRHASRAGLIVATGIATDATTSRFFASLVDERRLASLFSFFEIRRWFSATDDRRPFCLLTIANDAGTADFVFDAKSIGDTRDSRKRFVLAPSEIALLNPNTKTAPIFRSRADAELASKIYERNPVLIEESKGDAGNLWKLSFSRMFDMANDSHHFRTAKQLAASGAARDGRDWQVPSGADESLQPGCWLPLYEAKMIHLYDHRWATYGPDGEETRDITLAERQNPSYEVVPRYWVPAREVYLRTAKLPDGLLKALRDRHKEGIVLGVAQLFFGAWLRTDGSDETSPPTDVYPRWLQFILQQPFARRIAPIQLGLAGQNPPCLAPSGPDFVPAVPVDEVQTGCRSSTAWYQVVPRILTDYLGFAKRWTPLVERAPSLESDDSVIEFADVLLERATPRWLMGWRDICRSTDERTTISASIPLSAVGDKFLLASSGLEAKYAAALCAIMSSMTFDYVARQKVGGTSFKYFTMRQIACPSPSALQESDFAVMVPRILALSYTSCSMKPFAEDLGKHGPPFGWNGDHRARLRAELDAWIARLYGLTRDELRYILDPADIMGPEYPSETFRVLKENEDDKKRGFGEYRTSRLILDAWDRIQRGELA
jgi:hypothetical protein